MRVLLLLNVALTLIIWALLSPVAVTAAEEAASKIPCGPCTMEYKPQCLTIKKSFTNRCLVEKYNKENPAIKYKIIHNGSCECPAAANDVPRL